MDHKLSIKISTLSFFLMLIVVLIHARTLGYQEDSKSFVWGLQLYLNNLYQVAVPTFFFISGYLFFYSFQKKSSVKPIHFQEKLVKRIRTLLLPYVLWSLFWVIVLFSIQNIPQLTPYFGSPLHAMPWDDLLYKLFWEPINYPFWFLRELILYVAISPLIYVLFKVLKVYLVILCFIASIFTPYVLIIENFYIIKYFSLFFFILGSYFSIFSIELRFEIKPFSAILMLMIWLALAALELYLRVFVAFDFWILSLINHIMVLWGCLTCWLGYDVLDRRYDFQYKPIYAYAFFLYATHGIVIVMLIQATLSLYELNSLGHLLLYVFSFLMTTSICLGCGYVFKRTVPKLYYLSTGNR